MQVVVVVVVDIEGGVMSDYTCEHCGHQQAIFGAKAGDALAAAYQRQRQVEQ
jgi:hypothetical protein